MLGTLLVICRSWREISLYCAWLSTHLWDFQICRLAPNIFTGCFFWSCRLLITHILSGGTRIPYKLPQTNQRGRSLPRTLVIHAAQPEAPEHRRRLDLLYPFCIGMVNILAQLYNRRGRTGLNLLFISMAWACIFKIRVTASSFAVLQQDQMGVLSVRQWGMAVTASDHQITLS